MRLLATENYLSVAHAAALHRHRLNHTARRCVVTVDPRHRDVDVPSSNQYLGQKAGGNPEYGDEPRFDQAEQVEAAYPIGVRRIEQVEYLSAGEVAEQVAC